MTEEIFTAEENLAYIRGIMEKTRKRTSQAGPFLAFWGTLSAFVTLAQYFAVMGNFPHAYMPYLWGSFWVAGIIFTIMKGKQLARDKVISGSNDLITTNLFTSIGISLGIFILANIVAVMLGAKDHMGTEICYVISIVMAIAFYASSYSTGIKWFRLVAYGWWVAVILFIVKPFADQYLLLTIAILDFLLLALPGFKLMALAKNDDA